MDIEQNTLTIDCEDLEKINNQTKALLIVHPWGYPCNKEKIIKIVEKYNLKLIEDCSHAHGAIYNNKKLEVLPILVVLVYKVIKQFKQERLA